MSYDHHCWGKDTESGNEINLYADVTSVPAELISYIETLKQAITIFPGISQWLYDDNTITHGRDSSIRTDYASKTIVVNREGSLLTLNVVDLYVPVGTVEAMITEINSVGSQNLRLLGHLNGREVEAIILDTNVTIHLVVDLVEGTTKIVEKEVLSDTSFTAAIYESDILTPFTATIYDNSDPGGILFTAEIYET